MEEVDADTASTIWTLGNGARVILRATENRNDEIVVNALARGGTSSASDADGVSARFAAEMLAASGLGPWSVPDMARILAPRQASLSYAIGNYDRRFTGSSTEEDLQTLFEMLHLRFTDSRMDAEAVGLLLNRHRDILVLRGDNPRTVLGDEINRVRTGGHPRYRHIEAADIDDVDIDTALRFVRRGLNPADFTFVFVGNLTPEMLRPYVETYLASIPAGTERLNSWTDLGVVRPGRIAPSHVFAGIEEQSIVNMSWFAPATFSEQLNVTAAVLQSYLNTLLWEEIRENRGGVYSIGAGVGLTPSPRGEVSMVVQFAGSPARVDELVDAILVVLGGVSTGVNAQTLVNAREAVHQSWIVSMQNNAFIAQMYANSAVTLNLPLARIHNRPQFVNTVTPAMVQSLAAQLVQNGPATVALFRSPVEE